jgi:hypothetical protein
VLVQEHIQDGVGIADSLVQLAGIVKTAILQLCWRNLWQ